MTRRRIKRHGDRNRNNRRAEHLSCDVRGLVYIANRMRQLASGRAEFHETSRPTDGVDKEAIANLAKKLVICRLLEKNGQRLAHGRTSAQQSAAFATARQLTNNAAQKTIMKEWGECGSIVFKRRREELITHSAADTAGVRIDELRKSQKEQSRSSNDKMEPNPGKKLVGGSARANRWPMEQSVGKITALARFPTTAKNHAHPENNTFRLGPDRRTGEKVKLQTKEAREARKAMFEVDKMTHHQIKHRKEMELDPPRPTRLQIHRGATTHTTARRKANGMHMGNKQEWYFHKNNIEIQKWTYPA